MAFWKLSELYELMVAKNCSSEVSAGRKISLCERQMLRMMGLFLKKRLAKALGGKSKNRWKRDACSFTVDFGKRLIISSQSIL